MLRARDAMNREVRHIAPDESLAELEQRLLAERIGGVPVVEQGRLVGIVSRSDVVRVLASEQAMADSVGDFYREFQEDPFAAGARVARAAAEDPERSAEQVAHRLAGLCVRDAMVTDVVSVDADAPLREVAEQLVEHRIHRLVVTEGDRLAGIVTTLDLARLIAEGRLG